MKNSSVLMLLFSITCAVACDSAGIVNNADAHLANVNKNLSLRPDMVFSDLGDEIIHPIDLQIVNDTSLVIRKQISDIDSNLVAVFSLPEMSCLGTFVRNGRGPSEMLSPRISNSVSASEYLLMEDSSLGSMYEIDIQRTVQSGLSVFNEVVPLPHDNIGTESFSDSLFVRVELSGNELVYSIVGKDNTIYARYHPFEKIDAQKYMTKLSGIVAGCGDISRFAVALACFPQIIIIDTLSGEMRTVVVDQSYKRWRTVLNSPFDMNIVEYYVDIAASSDFVFALYRARSIGERMSGIFDSHIHVFDWNGNFLYDISVGEKLSRITFDEAGGFLYAIDTADDSIVRYDILRTICQCT